MRHKTRALTGTVLEVDGDSVYLEASNGVEMTFGAAELEVDTPASAPTRTPGGTPVATATLRARTPAGAAVGGPGPNPKHQELLGLIPESVLGLAAVRFARDPKSPRNGWATATPTAKLDWVCRVTGLSVDQLGTLARAGKGRQIEAHSAVAMAKNTGR